MADVPGFWYKGYFYPEEFSREKLEAGVLETFPFKDGDVVIDGFMKTGTTWLKHVLLAMYDDWGLCTLRDERDASCLEWPVIKPEVEGIRPEWRRVFREQLNTDSIPSPRLFRTHLPYEIFPQKALQDKKVKVIYISRNPKDTCVSYYHYVKDFASGSWHTTCEDTIHRFIKGTVTAGPFLNHVISWRKLGENDNVFHIDYEEMKHDLAKVVEKLADFLCRPLTASRIRQVVEETSVESMRKAGRKVVESQEVKNFIRRGGIGDWKNHFTVAQSEMFDREISEKFKKNDINFTYE
ncbi:sulfotransferase 2A1-like [Ptychodera flava]|uniref:sulfotransferase 2A1-like n=1 Tax=Ptychodera flava TaxID=63121 RepID=UPI00396A5664